MTRRSTLALLSILVSPAIAAQPAFVPPPPPLPPPAAARTPPPRPAEPAPSAEPLETEVRIYESPRGTIQEYSVAGRVYMVKIIPRRGLPYYLVDMDGDGLFESRQNDLSRQPIIPQWVLFSW